MKKEYIIFNQRLAGLLMQCGFVLKRMEKANDNSNRNIFVFNNTDDLIKKVNQYKKIIK